MTELLTSPTFVALIQAAGVGLLVILAAVSQRFGHRKETAQPASKDVYVPALSIADNQVIADATGTLKEANHHIRDRNNLDREMLFQMKLQTEHLEDTKHCMQEVKELLQKEQRRSAERSP
jgi:hypothetical protein